MNTILKKTFIVALLSVIFTQAYCQVPFMRAAEEGDAKAQYKLGKMYAQDGRYQKDIAKALYWYRKSAEQNCKEEYWH